MYAIKAYRSGGSVFGAATAWTKEDGKVMTFETMQEAEDKAKEYNVKYSSPNVYYSAAEYRD